MQHLFPPEVLAYTDNQDKFGIPPSKICSTLKQELICQELPIHPWELLIIDNTDCELIINQLCKEKYDISNILIFFTDEKWFIPRKRST